MKIREKLKCLFVQLPVISHDLKYNFAHCPYASYILAAYLKKYLNNVDVVRLPDFIEVFGSDNLIVENIIKINPDVLCFSVYLWNVERSLYIAKCIKERLSDTIIIFGGPEITNDNDYVIKNSMFFDFGIVGPGENTLLQIVNMLNEHGKQHILNNFDDRNKYKKDNNKFLKGINVDLSHANSPYLCGIGKPSYNKSILIETMRGCIHSCAYCYYHKNFKRLFLKPEELVVSELRWAALSKVEEISFVDPSFLKRKNIIRFLKTISKISSESDYKIFCELNAEDITLELANLLSCAKVKNCEIGIQSVNKETLKLINRGWNKDRFIKGVKLLRERGIEVLLDFIVGLPGDRIDDVLAGCSFALENGLFDDLGVYPLSVLPGTELRERKKDFGIFHLEEPPYTVVKTTTMSLDDIKECFFNIEQEIDIDLFPREFPLTSWEYEVVNGFDKSMVYEIELGDSGITLSDFLNSSETCFSCVVLFKFLSDRWLIHFDYFLTLFKNILDKNPYTLFDIIIDAKVLKSYSFPKILTNLKKIMKKRSYYIDRVYCDTIDDLRSTQMFLLLDKNAEEKCIVAIPSSYLKSQDETSVFWFKIYGVEDDSLEEFFLDKFSYLTGVEDFSYRISYEKSSTRYNLPLKKVKLKM